MRRLADAARIDSLIDRQEAMSAFERIEPELYRYPAIDPATFRRAAEEAFGEDLEV